MWFKNLTPVKIDHMPQLYIDSGCAIGNAAEEYRIRDCGPHEPQSIGWGSLYIDPAFDCEQHVHCLMQIILLRYSKQERVLPPATIRQAIKERSEQYQPYTDIQAPGRERTRLRDEVIMELLPKALIKPSHVDVVVDKQSGWVFIDSTSAKVVDDICALLRKTFDGLKLSRPDLGQRMRTLMTHWLSTAAAPEGLEFGDNCKLTYQHDSSTKATISGYDLTNETIQEHLKGGMQASSLAMMYQERLAFALHDGFQLSKIQPQDILITQMQDIDGDDALATLDGELALMVGEFRELVMFLANLFEYEVQAAA